MDKVSIIIPTYKGDNKLVEAIESVLNQTYRNVEIIVIDDNDPDSIYRMKTEKMIEPYIHGRVLYYKHEKNKNGSAARNTGLRHVTGEYVAFLDDDDIYHEDRIKKCVSVLERNVDYDAVYTAVEIYLDDDKVDEIHPFYSGRVWRELMLHESMIGTGSNLFFRTKALRETGMFDEELIRYQDLDYMVRFLKSHSMFALDEVLVKKRNHGNLNIPNYEAFCKNKELIFRKFAKEIEEFNDEDRRTYYSGHYKSLLNYALKTGNRKYIIDAKQRIESIRRLTIKEYISVLFPILFDLNYKAVLCRQKNLYRKK